MSGGIRAAATGWVMAAATALTALFAGSAAAELREYVQRPDDTYGFDLVSTREAGPVTLYNLKLRSQTWQGIPWEHWLTVIRPREVVHRDTALLFITGGSNRNEEPTFEGDRDRMVLELATRSQSVAAVLRQVPNQPLFDGRNEDEIIAYTFDKYLKGEGEDWPLLLPMVKSAVRAMDAVQQFAKAQWQQEIEGFVVTGASKRGWTTWLTAASDPRVKAIAPMVIDVLNMPEQMERQLMSYGEYSEQIHDYSELGIQKRQSTPEGRRLNALVDPYSYREGLTMPKLLLLGTNDPYWTVDAANVYLKDLKGPTYVHYEPNAGHGLGPGAYPALLAFYQAVLADELLPDYQVEYGPDGNMQIRAEGSPQINVWVAQSADRDFRNEKWVKYPLENIGGVLGSLGFSELGYAAYFVEFVYKNDKGVEYTLSSQMNVLPAEFPYDEEGVKIARPEPKGEPPNTPAPQPEPQPEPAA